MTITLQTITSTSCLKVVVFALKGGGNMEADSKKSNTSLWIIFSVAILFVGLYWFVIRPSNIRSACSEGASHESVLLVNHGGGAWEPDTAKRTQEQQGLAGTLYTDCLHEHGLDQ